MDPDGAQWTLRLYGPGRSMWSGPTATSSTAEPARCRNRSTRSPSPARSRPSTRLVGTVFPNPDTQNAKVFFQNLVVTPTGELGKIDVGQVSNFRTVQNGILAIDMPNFYLAHTETTKPSGASPIHTSAMSAG